MIQKVLLWACVAMGAASVPTLALAQARGVPSKQIDLVLSGWMEAAYNAQDKSDCPKGLNPANKDIWLAQFPTEAERDAEIRRHLYLGPSQGVGGENPIPLYFYQNRGPHGEHVLYSPELFKDPQLKEVQGHTAIGLNLTGEVTGAATAFSLKHQKFTSPEGEPGIDNQLYRALGCSKSFRDNQDFYDNQIRSDPNNRVLLRIGGVDDERNDPDVDIAIYRGIGVDGPSRDEAGAPIAWQSQRIDVRYPEYMSKTKGRIVDGVLLTDPVDHRFFTRRITATGERFIRGMRLKLKLTDKGAEGLLGGYENLREWWRLYRNGGALTVDQGSLWNPPSVWEAVHRLADGYPDPKTGKATAISAAYKVKFTRGLIVEPSQDDPVVTEATLKAMRQALLASGSRMAANDRSRAR